LLLTEPERKKNTSFSPSTSQVDLTVDADGIARLVPPDPPDAKSAGYVAAKTMPCSLLQQAPCNITLDTAVAASSVPEDCRIIVFYPGAGDKSLSDLIVSLVSTGAANLTVHVTGNCAELEPLELEAGDVELCGSCSETFCLTLPGLRITGGALSIRNLAICATEENRVRAGQLKCTDCSISARNGCGVLCLQKAKVFLTGCEVKNCLRSGIGVNGKHTEIELKGCTISQNNFSGIGVNHQAKSISLAENRISENGYHGIWLNVGVAVKWLSGTMCSNRLVDKGGPGILQGWDDIDANW
jgi:hypothetical protein